MIAAVIGLKIGGEIFFSDRDKKECGEWFRNAVSYY